MTRLFVIFSLFLSLLALTSSAATRTSVQTGDYSTASTWDCGCVPATTDDIVIAAGHTVTLSATTTLSNLTIQGTATLVDAGNTLKINGDVVLNGAITNTKNIKFQSSNGRLSGTGVKTGNKKFVFFGNYQILSGSDLTLNNGNIQIRPGVTVTNLGTITVLKTIAGTDATATWVNGANSTLKVKVNLLVNGVLTADAVGNTVEYVNNGNRTIKQPSGSYYNLTANGSGTATLGGAITVINDFTVGSGETDLSGNNLSVGGNFTKNATLTTASEVITLNGSGDQVVTGTAAFSLPNLTINKSAGEVQLGQDLNVDNTLTMTNGDINANGKTLTCGTSTASIGTLTYTSGNIIGKFKKWYNTAGVKTIPLGVSGTSRSVSLNITGLTTAGSLICEFVATDPGNSGLPLVDGAQTAYNQFNEGYWTLTPANGMVVSGYDLDLTGDGMTTFSIVGDTRLLRRATSGAWSAEGTHAAAVGNVVKRTGLTTLLSEFGFADITNCTAPTTSAITGETSICTSDLGKAYSVTNNTASTYTWTITGGTQASGGTTNSITVDWGATGGVGDVQVVENNGCANGAPVNLAIDINAMPTSAITGSSSVPENAVSAYSVTSRTGYTYTWTANGGTIQTGQSTSSITVLWGAAGSGSICVDASCSCGSAAQECLNVSKYAMIESLVTGNYGNTATWSCACVPSNSQNIKVKNGHTVTIDGTYTINSVEIESGGTIADGGNNFSVKGDLIVNGTYTGTAILKLKGLGTNIDGTGTISNTGLMRIEVGAKTILSTANLNRTGGDLFIKSGIMVTNNGQLTISDDLRGQDAASTFLNGANATLSVGQAIMATGILSASATGNTVVYNADIAQSVAHTDFYNLTFSGASTITLNNNVTAAGNVTLNSGSNLDGNNFNFNVGGNWTNSGGTFTMASGEILFNGANQTFTSATPETFVDFKTSTGAIVTIVAGSEVSVSGVLDNDGTIDNDGKITFTNGYDGQVGTLKGSGTHVIKGNWNLAGTFTKETSTVEFSGASAQTIAGNASDFHHVLVNNGSGVSITGGAHSARGTVTLTNGNFATNDAFTLKSDASGTGRIAEITGGSISGKLTAQRYVSSASNKWRMIAAPVNSTTFADYGGEMYTTGIPGSDDPSNWSKTYYWYDETITGAGTNGWVAPSNMSDALVVGRGYYVQFTNTNLAVDLSGYTNTGLISLPVTYTADSGPLEDGWNIVANPFPSEIDWDAAGWTKTNLNNAIYIWNPDLGVYATYVAGLGTNGGSRYLAQGQAFYVQTNASSPILRCDESVKVATNPSFFKSPALQQTMLKLIVTKASTGMSDEMVLNFGHQNYRAIKKYSHDDRVVEIAAVVEDTEMVIANVNLHDHADINIPIMLKTEEPGEATLDFTNISVLTGLSCVSLADLETGDEWNLHETNTVTVDLAAQMTTPRFVIRISKSVDIASSDLSCPVSQDGKIVVHSATEPHLIHVFNDEQEMLAAQVTEHLEVDELAPGNYKVYVETSACSSAEREVTIEAPARFSHADLVESTTCVDGTDGSVEIAVMGGTAPYSYLWSNGQSGSRISNLSEGTYSFIMTDANECSYTGEAVVNSSKDRALVIDAQISEVTGGGFEVSLTSEFKDEDVFVWMFEDGHASIETNPVYQYEDEEIVKLVVLEGQCEYWADYRLPGKSEPLAVASVDQEVEHLHLTRVGNTVTVTNTGRVITIYNISGALVKELSLNEAQFDIDGLNSGVYLVTDGLHSAKLVIQK